MRLYFYTIRIILILNLFFNLFFVNRIFSDTFIFKNNGKCEGTIVRETKDTFEIIIDGKKELVDRNDLFYWKDKTGKIHSDLKLDKDALILASSYDDYISIINSKNPTSLNYFSLNAAGLFSCCYSVSFERVLVYLRYFRFNIVLDASYQTSGSDSFDGNIKFLNEGYVVSLSPRIYVLEYIEDKFIENTPIGFTIGPVFGYLDTKSWIRKYQDAENAKGIRIEGDKIAFTKFIFGVEITGRIEFKSRYILNIGFMIGSRLNHDIPYKETVSGITTKKRYPYKNKLGKFILALGIGF